MLLAAKKRVNNPLLSITLVFTLLLSNALFAAVEKSPVDPKKYAAITLDNQLRVLLISNPAADKAAASMNVAVGSSANPENRAGLAHFLEHMLFLGTAKYPKAGEYQEFISSHGGGHNAYTSQENTNYFFDISADNLEPALDRFAHFFISPLFDEKYVDRERHAVHSEYKAKIKDDFRRSYAITKQLMNQKNSYNRFAVGNLDTLINNDERRVREDLLAFYNQYYSANIMTLVVLGKEPLEQLEEMVIGKFAAVKNHEATLFKTNEPLFNEDQLPQQVNIQTIKDIHSLTLTFPTNETRSHWKAKPLYYISSLMGYEGEGSLLSFLKTKGWATSLSASQGHNLAHEASFMVNIQLTEEGEKEYLKITQAVFQYIELLKRQGIKESLYNEEKQLSEISFRFQEQAEPIHLVSRLSSQMQHYPTELAISADYHFDNFDPLLIRGYLDQLTPDNLFISLKSNKPQTEKVEPYYNAPYSVAKLSSMTLSALKVNSINSALTIRKENPFIAEDLSLLANEKSEEKPTQIDSATGFSLWHKTETRFNIPQTDLYFTIQSPIANQTANNWVLNKLYTQMLQEQLNETLYDAYLAGLSTQIYPHLKGFTVRLSGYNDKLDLLLSDVLHAIKNPDFNEVRFNIYKQKYADGLVNALKDKPYNQTTARLYELLLPQWNNEEQTEALSHINIESLKQFSSLLIASPSLKVLTHGNLDRDTSLKMGQTVKNALLNKSVLPIPEIHVAQIPKNDALKESLTINHNDSAISLLLQGESNSIQARAELSLVAEILATPFYNEIRTEKQLGYIVFATPLQMNKTPAIAFIVQSPAVDADALENNIDEFLNKWEKELLAVSPEKFSKFKRSVISRVLKKDNKLSTQTKRYWRELDWGDTHFDTRERLADRVQKVMLSDVQRAFTTLKTRRLTVSSTGTQFDSEQTQKNQLSDEKVSEIFSILKKDGVTVPDA